MTENPADVLGQVRHCLDEWEIDVASVTLASLSENIVYRVVSCAGESFALRIHRPGYHTLEELESEHQWTAALAGAGFRLPVSLSAKAGSFYVPVQVNGGTRYAGLIEWLPGRSLESLEENGESELTQSVLQQLAVVMAGLHDHSEHWPIPAGFVRHRLDIDGFFGHEPFWGRYWESPYVSAEQRRLLLDTQITLEKRLQDLGTDPEVFGVIHADLHHGNLLVDGTDLYLIDFDDSGFGWYLYDIAVALYEYEARRDFDKIIDGFIKAYCSVRSLDETHLALLPMFFHIRARAIIGWATARPELDNAERIKMLVEKTCDTAQIFT